MILRLLALWERQWGVNEWMKMLYKTLEIFLLALCCCSRLLAKAMPIFSMAESSPPCSDKVQTILCFFPGKHRARRSPRQKRDSSLKATSLYCWTLQFELHQCIRYRLQIDGRAERNAGRWYRYENCRSLLQIVRVVAGDGWYIFSWDGPAKLSPSYLHQSKRSACLSSRKTSERAFLTGACAWMEISALILYVTIVLITVIVVSNFSIRFHQYHLCR